MISNENGFMCNYKYKVVNYFLRFAEQQHIGRIVNMLYYGFVITIIRVIEESIREGRNFIMMNQNNYVIALMTHLVIYKRGMFCSEMLYFNIEMYDNFQKFVHMRHEQLKNI